MPQHLHDLLIRIWDYRIWAIKNHEYITVRKLVIASLVIMIGVFLSFLIKKYFKKHFARGNFDDHAIATIEWLAFYFCLVTFVFLALHIVHIPLTTFAFLGGALAVGVGFGAQNLLNNFISGFIIMTERPIKVGDLVEVDNVIGKVESIGNRCTKIVTGDNIHKLIPNSMILEKLVTNWTHQDGRVRLSVPIGIAYESDIHQASEIMLDAVKKCDVVLSDPEPFVVFSEHGDSTLNFTIYFWTIIRNTADKLKLESQVNYNLNDLLRAANVEIAFPQLDVHLSEPPRQADAGR